MNETRYTLPDHVPENLVHDLGPYLAPNACKDPYHATDAVLRDLPPVFYAPSGAGGVVRGTWVVTRHQDIREVYRNHALYSTADTGNFQSLVGETFRWIPLTVDPPEHGKYRALLDPWFSPNAVDGMEPKIRATINDLIDGFVDAGEVDLAYDFGRIYPVRIFMDLMGFPAEMFEDFLQWEYALLHNMGDIEKMKWGIGSAIAYLREFIEHTRRNPSDNLTSHIVRGEVDGRPLTDDEIIGTVNFLWVGGLDTVAATTSLMFRRLALEPEAQAALRQEPDLIVRAVEEFLRVQPLVNSSRLVKEDHDIQGVQIKQGDHIMCFNAAGNFDPKEFENPRELCFERRVNRHFTLAGGPHRCLGSNLARRELRVALAEVLRRLPPFRLKPGADETAVPGLVAMPHLPVVWSVDGCAT